MENMGASTMQLATTPCSSQPPTPESDTLPHTSLQPSLKKAQSIPPPSPIQTLSLKPITTSPPPHSTPPSDFTIMSQPSTSTSISSPISPLMTSEIMVGVVIFLFLVFIILFCFYLYSKRYSGANPSMMRSASTTRYILHGHHPAAPRSGLHPDTLKSLPIIVFKAQDSAHGVECAVCLSDLAEDEQMRVLPKCRHGFHVDCIDMWFHSHNTCPLCRAPVTLFDDADDATSVVIPVDNSSSTSPANLLVWGSREGVSTGIAGMDQVGSGSSSAGPSRKTEGMLVIEIPRRRGFSSSPSSPLPPGSGRQETRSPMLTRIRSLRRMLSRGSRGMFNPSPRGGEVEQREGEGVVRTPMNV